jgi:3-isopropylmalate/(R)-2-methylmalate dehydratase small subunit
MLNTVSTQRPTTAPRLVFRGRCWCFGDNLSIDGDIMPFRFALAREMRTEVLKDFCLTAIDPEFPKKVAPGDIVVAGRRFGQGNPHIQGFLGLRGLSLGLVVESIPRGSLRNAINAGVPILPKCPGVRLGVETGDELEVDFGAGIIRNLTRRTEQSHKPLPEALLQTIRIGGWEAQFARRLAERGR